MLLIPIPVKCSDFLLLLPFSSSLTCLSSIPTPLSIISTISFSAFSLTHTKISPFCPSGNPWKNAFSINGCKIILGIINWSGSFMLMKNSVLIFSPYRISLIYMQFFRFSISSSTEIYSSDLLIVLLSNLINASIAFVDFTVSPCIINHFMLVNVL